MKTRPISAQLVDLHVYVIREDDWIAHRKLAENSTVVNDAVSAGFIRVLPSMKLEEVREEIHEQLGLDNVPLTFVFLRSVGRNFTQVKPHQENDLKAKYFCPPWAAEPELYLKSGDYQEGDSSALLDFETAAATSTPVGPNSVADDSRDSVSGGEAVKDEAKGVRRKSSTTSTASSKKDNKEKSSKSPSLGDNVNNNNDDENKTSDDDNPPDNEQSQIADNVLNNNKNNNSGIKNNTGDVKKDPTSGAPKGKRLSKAVQKRGENLLHRQVYSRARLKGVPSRNQEQRVGLTSDEERETDTFRETFNDIHETSVVDLRAAAFLNRSAPDLNSAGGDSSRLSYSESRKLNNTASNLSVGRSRYGHSLHDLNGESVASYNQRRMEKLRAKLDSLRSERQECEVQKEEMVKHVRGLHAKLIQEKEAVQEIWRKRYLDEKKLTPKLEEDSAKWRQELERIHKDMITKVEGRDPSDARSPFSRLEEPSNKVSYKIMVARLLQEIEDLKRRLETTKLRLSAEAKLRAMAEKDVRTLREDLIQKKIQVTLTRKETDSVIAPFYRDTIYSMHPLI